MRVEDIETSAARQGLALRGAFHPHDDDAVPGATDGRPAATVVLLGFTGQGGWPSFAKSTEARDGADHPLDRWSRRVISRMAEGLGARALFPFEGPPWHPFGRWAIQSGEVSASTLGILIHPRWGLWHSYRGALVFAERLELAQRDPATSPCATCDAKPCLHACPVSAFSAERYEVAACRTYLASPAGVECTTAGCLARRACPIGAEHAYGAEQTMFLMRAFTRG